MITVLKDNEIFVFGSNKAGKHLGGSAKQAHEQFKAEWGVGDGLTGQSYAFPTLDENFNQLLFKVLRRNRDRLYKCCEQNKDKVFLLTKVGCGIAGYKEESIKNLFKNQPINLILPDDWK